MIQGQELKNGFAAAETEWFFGAAVMPQDCETEFGGFVPHPGINTRLVAFFAAGLQAETELLAGMEELCGVR